VPRLTPTTWIGSQLDPPTDLAIFRNSVHSHQPPDAAPPQGCGSPTPRLCALAPHSAPSLTAGIGAVKPCTGRLSDVLIQQHDGLCASGGGDPGSSIGISVIIRSTCHSLLDDRSSGYAGYRTTKYRPLLGIHTKIAFLAPSAMAFSGSCQGRWWVRYTSLLVHCRRAQHGERFALVRHTSGGGSSSAPHRQIVPQRTSTPVRT
jgi:hypothetical protein